MTRLPGLTGKEVVRALLKAGFVLVRTSGSHHRLMHPKDRSRVATVPVHSSKALKRGTLHGIIKQAGLTVEEFVALLSTLAGKTSLPLRPYDSDTHWHHGSHIQVLWLKAEIQKGIDPAERDELIPAEEVFDRPEAKYRILAEKQLTSLTLTAPAARGPS